MCLHLAHCLAENVFTICTLPSQKEHVFTIGTMPIAEMCLHLAHCLAERIFSHLAERLAEKCIHTWHNA